MSRVEALGRCPVKGTRWQWAASLHLTPQGADGDRLWTPVGTDLRAVKATDLPHLAALVATDEELAEARATPLRGGALAEVRYYERTLVSTLHGGGLARRLSRAAGRELWLARSATSARFIWSSPVSLLLRSELTGLPGDVGRYRPNIVIDDGDSPLALSPGDRLKAGGVLLEVERELDRCLVINHHPVTGQQDHSLLKKLRPGVLLGHGCRVLEGGTITPGQELHLLPRG